MTRSKRGRKRAARSHVAAKPQRAEKPQPIERPQLQRLDSEPEPQPVKRVKTVARSRGDAKLQLVDEVTDGRTAGERVQTEVLPS